MECVCCACMCRYSMNVSVCYKPQSHKRACRKDESHMARAGEASEIQQNATFQLVILCLYRSIYSDFFLLLYMHSHRKHIQTIYRT